MFFHAWIPPTICFSTLFATHTHNHSKHFHHAHPLAVSNPLAFFCIYALSLFSACLRILDRSARTHTAFIQNASFHGVVLYAADRSPALALSIINRISAVVYFSPSLADRSPAQSCGYGLRTQTPSASPSGTLPSRCVALHSACPVLTLHTRMPSAFRCCCCCCCCVNISA